MGTIIFIYVVYDMLVRGKKGRKNPYANSFITYNKLMKLIIVKQIIVSHDIASNFQFGFQDPASTTFECIIDLHHDIMCLNAKNERSVMV